MLIINANLRKVGRLDAFGAYGAYPEFRILSRRQLF
jgi:hypothetical protein